MLDVIPCSELQITEDEVIDRGVAIGGGRRSRRIRASVRPPVRNQAGVLLVTLGRTVRAEVVILAVDGDYGTASGLVETRYFGGLFVRGMVWLQVVKRYMYRFPRTCCRTASRGQVS